VNVEKMNVTENPKISKQVKRIVSDEFQAVESAKGLYDLGLECDIAAEEAYGLLGIDQGKKTKPLYIYRGIITYKYNKQMLIRYGSRGRI
jgi:hypothetical protein